jgi:hypothetical protein
MSWYPRSLKTTVIIEPQGLLIFAIWFSDSTEVRSSSLGMPEAGRDLSRQEV